MTCFMTIAVRSTRWGLYGLAVTTLGIAQAQTATAPAQQPIARMSCAALAAEMAEHAAAQQTASDTMQAAAGAMLAAQSRQAEQAKADRRKGAGLAAAGSLAEILPGGGMIAGVLGSAAGHIARTGSSAEDRSGAELVAAQRQGQEAAMVAVRQGAAIGRMQELLTALTVRGCP